MNKIKVYDEDIEVENKDGIEVSIGEASKFFECSECEDKGFKGYRYCYRC